MATKNIFKTFFVKIIKESTIVKKSSLQIVVPIILEKIYF